MQRGFLCTGTTAGLSYKTKGSDNNDPTSNVGNNLTGSGTSDHVTNLRTRLTEAEKELRRRRQERLSIETKLGNTAHATKTAVPDVPYTSLATPGTETNPLTSLNSGALEALASHTEPPPAPLHRLAQALMLVLEARMLVDLGNHPLPDSVPWRNLQILFQKTWDPHELVDSIREALSQQPFGVRLVQHVRQRLFGGDGPLTRAQITSVDERCSPVFDFIVAMVGDSENSGNRDSSREPALSQVAKESTSMEIPTTSESRHEDESARESAVAAVVAQEQEVARLRRQLRAAQRSEEAAQVFATENAPAQQRNTSTEQNVVESVQVHAGSNLVNIEMNTDKGIPHTGLEKKELNSQLGSCSSALKVVSCMSLQYCLNEIVVPVSQETLLLSLARAVTEPRIGDKRNLQIVGFAEDREETETALQRADAVQDWLVTHKVPASRLHVTAVPDQARGNRRVELRLLDDKGGDETIRKRAEKLLSQVFQAEEPVPTDAPAIPQTAFMNASLQAVDKAPENTPANVLAESIVESADTSQPKETSSGTTCANASPCVSVEEIADPACGGHRVLRVVFVTPGLVASDTSLEVGTQAVRLASLSGAWPELEVPLPFPVDPPTEGAARFSRKAGSLTLRLQAVG